MSSYSKYIYFLVGLVLVFWSMLSTQTLFTIDNPLLQPPESIDKRQIAKKQFGYHSPSLASPKTLVSENGEPTLTNHSILSEIESRIHSYGCWQTWHWADANVDKEQFAKAQLILFEAMVAESPARAAAYVDSIQCIPNQNEAACILVECWVQDSREDAFNWLEQQQLEPYYHSAYSRIMHRYADIDPDEAALLVESMQGGNLMKALSQKIAHHKAKKNPFNAVSWANTLHEEEARYTALERAFGVWSSHSPRIAFEQALGDPFISKKTDLLDTLANSYAFDDPRAAAESLYNVSDIQAQTSLANHISRAWSEKPLSGDFKTWLQNISIPEVKDSAIEGLTEHLLSRKDWKSALDWQNQITDPQKRFELLKDALLIGIRLEPQEDTLSILHRAQISTSQQQEILQAIEEVRSDIDFVFPEYL